MQKPANAHCVDCKAVLEPSERITSYFSGLVPGEFKCRNCMESKANE